MSSTSHIGCASNVKDIDMTVYRRRILVCLPNARITREEEELAATGIVHFRLGSYTLLARGIGECWQWDDVLGLVHGRGHVVLQGVLQQAGIPARGRVGTAILPSRGLEQRIQLLAVGADGQAFETLVVLPALSRVAGNGVLVRIVDWRVVGRKTLSCQYAICYWHSRRLFRTVTYLTTPCLRGRTAAGGVIAIVIKPVASNL